MHAVPTSFTLLLSLIWFLAYWILGGVFFALVALARLGRLHRVTFSCLFTLLAVACATGAAWGGMQVARHEVDRCLEMANSRAEAITAVFGCGFVGVFGMFLVGAVILVLVGFLIMALSSTKEPILTLEQEPEEPEFMAPPVAPVAPPSETPHATSDTETKIPE